MNSDATTSGLAEEMALRIGLAARQIPEIGVAGLVQALIACIGKPITNDKVQTLRADTVRAALPDADLVAYSQIKEVVRLLKDHAPTLSADDPPPSPVATPTLTNPVRVAFASNRGERLDGHFGSCLRFLVYDVTAEASELVDLRTPGMNELDGDRNLYRAKLLHDCHVLYVNAIGGPAAAKVVRQGIHVVAVSETKPCADVIQELRRILAHTPPPWLARILGKER